MELGVIGLGIVGGALYDWFKAKTTHNVYAYDPKQGHIDDIKKADFVFICVPVPTRKDGTQNTSILEDSINRCNKKATIFVRSTVLPGTCDALTTRGRPVHSMPEFLTARHAASDMWKLPLLVGTCDQDPRSSNNLRSVVADIFPNKGVHVVKNSEAEITKYLHNAIAFVKVWTCNQAYTLSQLLHADYDAIKKAVLISGLINPEHTNVPGPDGKIGVGNACLPKDIYAFAVALEKRGVSEGKILKQMYKANEKYRTGEKFTE